MPAHPDPAKFNGDRDGLRSFLAELHVKLLVNKDWYADEQARLAYAVSRLEDKAHIQILPFIADGRINLDSLKGLEKMLQNAFGDPDPKGTAQQKLKDVRQKNRPFAEYYAEWSRYAPDTGYDDEAKRSALKTGLSEELRYHLISQDEESQLDAFVAQLQKLDNHYRQV